MKPARCQAGWPIAGGTLLLLLMLAALGYRDTLLHVVASWNQWQSGEYYAHGYLVLLMSLFLVWRERGRLLALPPCPQPGALLAIAACSLLWAVASITGVLLVQTAVLVPLLLAVAWTTLGLRITGMLLVPIAVLIFAMPAWDRLTPLLQDITTHFVYAMTRLAGIPALREDYLVVLPSGQLAIEESCSGLSYLLAALTLGMLYGYLYYRRVAARVIVVLVAGAAAILANILRVFIVVVVAYHTQMQHSIVYRHFGLGWYLFGGLVLMLLVIDVLLHRRYFAEPVAGAGEVERVAPCNYSAWQRAGIAAIAALLLCGGPLLAWRMENSPAPRPVAAAVGLPDGTAGWRGPVATDDRWSPVFRGASEQLRVYHKGDSEVFVYLGYYARQQQGRELVFDLNRISDDLFWRRSHVPARRLDSTGPGVTEKVLVSADGQQRLVWYWYRVAHHNTTGRIMAKILQVLGIVTGRQQAAVIALASDVTVDADATRATLQDFMVAMRPHLVGAADGRSTIQLRESE